MTDRLPNVSIHQKLIRINTLRTAGEIDAEKRRRSLEWGNASIQLFPDVILLTLGHHRRSFGSLNFLVPREPQICILRQLNFFSYERILCIKFVSAQELFK